MNEPDRCTRWVKKSANSCKAMTDQCPVCIEAVAFGENRMCMPQCGHVVHTTCALNAAQYDVRCPVCRAQDPRLEPRQSGESRILAQVNEYARAHRQHVREYNRRKNNIMRRSTSMRKLRDDLKKERRELCGLEKTLGRTWMNIQKAAWATDADLQALKNRRKRQLRKVSTMQRRYDQLLVPLLGEAPEW